MLKEYLTLDMIILRIVAANCCHSEWYNSMLFPFKIKWQWIKDQWWGETHLKFREKLLLVLFQLVYTYIQCIMTITFKPFLYIYYPLPFVASHHFHYFKSPYRRLSTSCFIFTHRRKFILIPNKQSQNILKQ